VYDVCHASAHSLAAVCIVIAIPLVGRCTRCRRGSRLADYVVIHYAHVICLLLLLLLLLLLGPPYQPTHSCRPSPASPTSAVTTRTVAKP